VEQKQKWKNHLSTLVHCYNCTPHQTTGFSPYKLMFGRDPKLPVDHMFGVSKSGDMTETAYFKNLRKELQYCHELAERNMKSSADKTKTIYDKKTKECCLEVGDR
ncbi:hypothetical protein ScPMuIL_003586, partial [Solemya velum]